jgi:predicted secreted Zn-dependent protease
MTKTQALPHKPTKKRRRARDEERAATQPANNAPHRPDLLTLQNQIGNRAVQRLLAQRGEAGVVQLDPEDVAALVDTAQHEEDEGAAAEALDTGVKHNGAVKIENVVVETYDVSGGTLNEVYTQLDPEEWGRCTYTFDYDYDSVNGKTSKVNITLKLVIRLPRWTDIDKASPAARKEWNRMLAALQGHEEKHAALARTWAPIFKQRMLGLDETKVADKHTSTLAEVDKATKKYDDASKHGQTEGVSLDRSIK